MYSSRRLVRGRIGNSAPTEPVRKPRRVRPYLSPPSKPRSRGRDEIRKTPRPLSDPEWFANGFATRQARGAGSRETRGVRSCCRCSLKFLRVEDGASLTWKRDRKSARSSVRSRNRSICRRLCRVSRWSLFPSNRLDANQTPFGQRIHAPNRNRSPTGPGSKSPARRPRHRLGAPHFPGQGAKCVFERPRNFVPGDAGPGFRAMVALPDPGWP